MCDSFGTMQTKTAPVTYKVLDERNARHVEAAEKWLQEGNVAEACKELRNIQRAVAGHPTVIDLRRRLVAVLCGWEEEKEVAQAQP